VWSESRHHRRHECCSVVHTETIEDYLKATFELTTRREGATTSTLAEHLGVAPPTVSTMVKRLAAGELVSRQGLHRIELTAHGRRHALAVVRRHRLIEEFLVKSLGMPWEDVHDEAEVLEHAVSDRLLERIDAYLGHPTHDPHGDPIPPADGPHLEQWNTRLSQAPVGNRFHVQRVQDRDPAALHHLGLIGIRPGVTLDVVEQGAFGGPLWVSIDGARHPLGTELTAIVFGVLA
jgi:DtxR family transcriptional regulator, Mn-dependent transcriptional regulator